MYHLLFIIYELEKMKSEGHKIICKTIPAKGWKIDAQMSYKIASLIYDKIRSWRHAIVRQVLLLFSLTFIIALIATYRTNSQKSNHLNPSSI